jgi:hypothetical protein
MAIFEYQCPKGHVSERMVPLAERPHEVLCDHIDCDDMAKFVVSATPTTFRAMDRKAFKRGGR